MKLREYQQQAVSAIEREWQNVQSTLLLMATGTGKTRVAGEVIKRKLPERTLFLCHREELVDQAYNAIGNLTGIEPEIEMAGQRASVGRSSPIVIATVQTLSQEKRLARFRPTDFDLLIGDEIHHAPAKTWRRVIDYFKQNEDLRMLGLTATADRMDEETLATVIDSCAFEYGIRDAIADGYLVPVEQMLVEIEGLDFSRCRTTAGDLNGADLALIMQIEQTLHGVCDATLRQRNGKTLMFASSVAHAEMASDIFNRHRDGLSGWLCGKTPRDDRSNIFQRFSGKLDPFLEILCNVGIATEGVDIPDARVVSMGRPTKSRLLYTQIIGRALRPLTGLVDGISSAEDRCAAIRDSAKPNALVLDFVGNSGRHKLICTVDVLSPATGDEILNERVRKEIRNRQEPCAVDQIVAEIENKMAEEERLKEKRRKAAIVGTAKFKTQVVDPFTALGLTPREDRAWFKGKQLTLKQQELLRRQGVDPDNLSYAEGQQIINHLFHRWENKLATLKQCQLLKRYGVDARNMGMAEASTRIDSIASRGWRM
jgi:superfamily II DNA or RNA helicase